MKKFRSKETYTQGTYGGAPKRLTATILFLIAFLFSVPVQAQFFSTSNRHSTGDSKQSAQIQQLQSQNQQRLNENTAQDASIATNAGNIIAVSNTAAAMKSCGDAGQLYGPAHAQAAGSCVGALTINADGSIATGAGLNLGAGIKVGNVTTCDAAAEGTLRYNASTKELELCDGVAWKGLGGSGGCDYNYQGVVNADIDTYYTSDTPALSGFAGVQTATADGDGTVTIVKNGADTGQKSVSVGNGDQIGFRVKSSSNYSRAINLTMDIGSNFTSCWQVATKDQDATPDAFAFSDSSGVARGSLTTSNDVTITGIEGNVTVSISGAGSPQMSVAGGAWTNTDSVITDGQTLRLRLTAAADYEQTRVATVKIGTASQAWSVTTEVENQPSCKDWHAKGFTNSGVYTIDPDGEGGATPFDVYCNMTEDGGGWTLIATISSGGGSNWMNSAAWTSSSTFGAPTSTSLSSDMKNRAFSEVPFTQFIIWKSASARRITNVAGTPYSDFATMMGSGYVDHGGSRTGSWHSQPYFERYFNAITEVPGTVSGVNKGSFSYCVIAANFDFCPECGYNIGGGWGCYGGSCQRGSCGDVVRESSVSIYVK